MGAWEVEFKGGKITQDKVVTEAQESRDFQEKNESSCERSNGRDLHLIQQHGGHKAPSTELFQ